MHGLTIDRITTALNAEAAEQERMESLAALSQESLSVELVEETIRLLRDSLQRRIGDAAVEKLKQIGRATIDLAGTGGSGIPGRFNTSTASSFVVASCGVRVVKFGNGRITGTSGSADFLQVAGVPSLVNLDVLEQVLDQTHLAFLYAPAIYPELASLQSLRRRLGRPTVFNFIGPLLNPVLPEFRLMGVSQSSAQSIIANVLLDDSYTTRALVVRADNGLDEIACDCATTLLELSNNVITRRVITQRVATTYDAESPHAMATRHVITQREIMQSEINGSRFGEKIETPTATNGQENDADVANVADAAANVQRFEQIIDGNDIGSKAYQTLTINSAAALMACGKVASIDDGIEVARSVIASGDVRKLYDKCKVVYGKLS